MFTVLSAILSSSGFGALLGGLFAFLNRRVDIETKKLDLEHEARRWAHELSVRDKDIELAKAEAQGRREVAIIEGEAAMESARFNAIAEAQAADRVTADELKAAGKLRWTLVLAMAVNKWVRPLATIILAGAAIWINLLLIERLVDGWPELSATQRFDAAMQGLAWITGQAAAALSYWFVARGSSR